MIIGIISLITALSIAIAAAYYSIVGLVAIFSGAVVAVAIAASTLELGKIVGVLWLHKHWNTCGKVFRGVFVSQIAVLMLITSMGIFGFLSKAHLEQNSGTEQTTIQLENLNERKLRVINSRNRVEKMQSQLDDALDKYVSLGYVTRGLNKLEEQAAQREGLRKELNKLDIEEEIVDNNIYTLKKEQTVFALEIGPAKYVAELIYGDKATENLDKAVRYVIMLIIFVFDPLAVTLLIASQMSLVPKKDNAEVVIEKEDPEENLTPEQIKIKHKKSRMRQAGKTSSM